MNYDYLNKSELVLLTDVKCPHLLKKGEII